MMLTTGNLNASVNGSVILISIAIGMMRQQQRDLGFVLGSSLNFNWVSLSEKD
jgi:hypothetical protein